MRVIKRIMVFVSLLLITYFVFYVAVPAFIISGGIKPSAEKAEKIFYRDRDIIANVKNYIAENNYENIHIDEEDGKLYIYPENIVIDNKAKNQLQTLIFDKHYRVIGNDVNVIIKMYKNADSKCTILAKHSKIEYNLSGSDESELQKRHLREGEIYAERKSGGKY